jgi:hypothetical protein
MKKNRILTVRKLYRERFAKKVSQTIVGATEEQQKILDKLRTDGILLIENYFSHDFCQSVIECIDNYILHKNDSIDNIWTTIQNNPNAYKTGVLQGDGTSYWIDKHKSDHRIVHAELLSSHLNQQFSSNEFFLQIARLMLANQVEFNFTMANRTRFAEGNLGSGGGWHRDKNYQHGFKALVYLNDVTDDNGPFEYIRTTFSLKNHILDFPYPDKYQFTDEEIQAFLNQNKELLYKVKGKAGSLVLFNTNGIHRGSPILKGERYAITNYYK